ncbi:MAG: alpha/beta fold hydrolase [Candidatus Heimdallarchaeota archaeon]
MSFGGIPITELTVKANDIELAYETFGDPSAPPILLIAGIGEQMISWDEEFCQQLVAEGFSVIRFDNRDAGLSTKLDDEAIPNLSEVMQARSQRKAIHVPYTLEDMAADTVGLLDALEMEVTHVVGLSMGGMIGQSVAIHYPERVSTLTSIMSSMTPVPPPNPETVSFLVTPPPAEREDNIKYWLKWCRLVHGSASPLDEKYHQERIERAFDRSYYPQGAGRQFAAILASGSRREALKEANIPTLVIHGDADPLFPVSAGIDTAETIPGADLLIIEGMGHSIPLEFAQKVIVAIAHHAKES